MNPILKQIALCFVWMSIVLPSQSQSISLYPNPFSDTLWINLTDLSDDTVTVTCYNIYGNVEATLYDGEILNGNVENFWVPENLQNGVYFVTAAFNGDSVVQVSTRILYTSVDEKPPLRFKLFPNPTHASFYIATEENVQNVVIRDLNGRIIKEFGDKVVNSYSINNLEKGIYLVEIETTSNTIQSTIIKL